MRNNTVVKCIAIVLFAVMLLSALLSSALLLFGFGSGAFATESDRYDFKKTLLTGMTWNPISRLGDYVEYYEKHGDASQVGGEIFEEAVYNFMSKNLLVEIKDSDDKIVFSNIDDSASDIINTGVHSFSVLKEEYRNNPNNSNSQKVNDTELETGSVFYETTSVSYEDADCYENVEYEITVCLKKEFVVKDCFYYINELFNLVSNKQTTLFIIAIISILSSAALLVFIMCAAGHKEDFEGIYISKFDKFPLDIMMALFSVITLLLGCGIFWICDNVYFEMISYNSDITLWVAMPYIAVLVVIATFLDGILLAILAMTIAVRFKTETFVNTTITYKILSIVFRILKKIFSCIKELFKKSFKFSISMLRSIPLVWKTVLVVVVILIVEFLIFTLFEWGYFWPAVWIMNGILGGVAIIVAILLKRIKKGTEEIAKGNLYKKIDTKYMFLDIKDHAENINNINDGIAKAVEERMKSERFKTELITNVSHDIKTPLTSIINYVDLLEKEEIENETAKEYIDVLSRQSARLKKLIDDLLEASKVSTGNVNVNFSKLELGILLSQALGEYDEKFANCNLQVVLNKTDDLLLVMADNRHIWRVFDNILNNIAKYAQPNTRVYIDATRKLDKAEISFRNISKDPLNISGDELMERFVRGDSSRNTEGSGLGLSIAKSLTEIQKGKLDIQIDGDLFKVRLTFPLSE